MEQGGYVPPEENFFRGVPVANTIESLTKTVVRLISSGRNRMQRPPNI